MYINQIQIKATGTADSAFTRASFRAAVEMVAETGPQAKDKARPLIDRILAVVHEQAEAAGIETNRIKTSFSVAPHQARNAQGEYLPAGYKAEYTIEFNATNVPAATDVHDKLTSIAGITAYTPTFHLDNEGDIAKKAFADAWQKAQTKKADQCSALGLIPGEWKVVSWEENRQEGGGGKMMAMAALGEDKPLVEPGKAIHSVSVTFLYQRVV